MNMVEAWESFTWFLESGGDILVAIFVITSVMWTLILERVFYLHLGHRSYVETLTQRWNQYTGLEPWKIQRIRRMLVSEARQNLFRALPMIKTLVALCPLLGLMGTVTGMIEVFDVMAIAGNANPRAMASGVSKATIPTMAGMVAALSGLYMSVQLRRTAERKHRQVEELLTPSEV